MSRIRSARTLLAALVAAVRESQLTFLAAAVAFYAFVSIIPLALLGLALAQTVGGDALGMLLGEARAFLSPGAMGIVEDAVANRAGSGGATVVGLIVLAWSGIKVFRAIDVAFSHVYDEGQATSLPDQLLDAAVAVAVVPVGLVAAAGLGVLAPALGDLPLVGVASRLGLVVVLGIVFFPLYYRFPNTPITVREAIPGTLAAAVGWTLLATGFSLYATAIGRFQLYGVLGAGLLVVTWLYFGGSLIMLGAVLNAVLAEGSDGESEPSPGSSEVGPEPAPDLGDLAREVQELREEVDEKTVSRADLEGDLRAYVRRRVRRGKARGWGPYLVLLYGTVMTLGAFSWLSGGWAILAMVVVWLSTLGLYVLLVLFGAGLSVAGVPGRVADTVRDFRS